MPIPRHRAPAARLPLALFAAAAPALAAPAYELVDLTPGMAGAQAMACGNAINAAGHVAGYTDFDGDFYRTRAYVWADGQRTFVGNGQATAIDDADAVAVTSNTTRRAGQQGYVVAADGRTRLDPRGGVQYDFVFGLAADGSTCGSTDLLHDNSEVAVAAAPGGHPRPLDLPGRPTYSACQAMAPDATMAGVVQYQYIVVRAFVGTPGHWTLLPQPQGSEDVEAMAVNSSGTVTGMYLQDGGYHGFVFRDGVMLDLPTLGASAPTYGYGINGQGEVVGTSYGLTAPAGVLVEPDGTIFELDTLLPPATRAAWQVTTASAINDGGAIAGCARPRGGQGWHAILLTPR